MDLSELDAIVEETDMPVRPETLAAAWELTSTLEATGLPAGQVLLLVTLRARPGAEDLLAAAAQTFVNATANLPGALGSSLHRRADDGAAMFLIERFAGEEAFGAHMAAGYFHDFQIAQAPLLAELVEVYFLQR